jgi:hypothetical protein
VPWTQIASPLMVQHVVPTPQLVHGQLVHPAGAK